MPTWTESQLASIHKMLNPESIAVVGATPRLQYGGRMLAAALKAGDRVRVYPVNPRYDEIMETRCYPSVSALPEAPDLVGIVVPYDQVLEVLRESHEKGAGSAIVISAGFAERGVDARRDLQDQLGEFAAASGMRVSGPNCLGLANLKNDVWVSASSLGARGLPGPVGLVCQSGASAFGPFLTRAVDEGVGFTYVVSTGNEADLDFSDFVRYLLDDPETRVIAGFVEGFKDARKFIECAKLAAHRGKPIVLIKIGRSALGSRAALSHTAALTGEDRLYDAAMAQHGVIRVEDYDQLLEVSHLLAHCPKPRKPGIAVVSHSGGISSLTADMCGREGLDLPPLSQDATEGINGVLKGFGWAANPADVTGFANSESFPEIMGHMIGGPEVGTMVVASSGGDDQADQVIAQRDLALNDDLGGPKGVVFLWTGSRTATAGLNKLKQAMVPVFYTPNRLAAGLRSYQEYHAWRERRPTGTGARDGFPVAPETGPEQREVLGRLLSDTGGRSLSEHESKQLVAAWGIPVNREVRAATEDDAVEAARGIGYPVALKADSPAIPHKTEAGVIRLGLRDDAEVREAFVQVMSRAREQLGPGGEGGISGVLVQEMVADAVEVIAGVSYDPQLGPVLLYGLGGVMVELFADVALRLCPVDRPQALEMIAEVKGARLLEGFRGRPAADGDALADALVRLSYLGVNLDGRLAELDVNPLMVLPAGSGVKAVDALAVFRQ